MEGKRCTNRDCAKRPSFGIAGTKTTKLCSCTHTKHGMLDDESKKVIHRGCTKVPSYAVAGGVWKSCARYVLNKARCVC